MTVHEALKLTEARLKEVTDEARTEARLMLSFITGTEAGGLLFSEKRLSDTELARLEDMVKRRLTREPLQYIFGEWYFMGLRFVVTPDVLIPRQDTETLCEAALDAIVRRKYTSLLDICTGSGCIAVALKKLSEEKGLELACEASDISERSIAIAEKNAAINGAEIAFRAADLFADAGRYDVITANPPYISAEDMARLQDEVRFEPKLALEGGADGLDLYRRIALEVGAHINEGGCLIMEVGAGEAEAVRAMFEAQSGCIINDLNGVGRVVKIDF